VLYVEAVDGVQVEAVGAIADALAAARAEGRAPFERLFGSDPDTPCRTTYREVPLLRGMAPERVECVEVPIEDLRDAFGDSL